MDASPDPHAETLTVFDESDAPTAPRTTTEVAESLDCTRRTAYNRLERLADRGEIETKKVGARGRVWWRSPEMLADSSAPTADAESGTTTADADPAGTTAERNHETDGPTATDDTAIDEEAHLETEQHFRSLVKAVDEYAIFMLDPDGYVTSWNEGARRIKGYDRDEIVGEHFSAFYLDEDVTAGIPDQNLAHATAEGSVETEGWRVRADGSQFWANVTITALRDDGQLRGFAKVTRDMTDGKYVEAERRLLHSATRSIAEAETFEDGLHATLREVCEATDWDYGEAWVPAGDVLERASADYVARDELEPFSDVSRNYTFDYAEGLPGRVWKSGESEWISDVTESSVEEFNRTYEANEFGLKAGLGVPIKTDGEVAAVLVFTMVKSRSPDERLVEIVSSVAAELGGLFARQQTETALERETELVEHILETSPVGISVFASDGSVVRANERTADLLGLPSQDLDDYVAGQVEMKDEDGQPLPPDVKPGLEALETGDPVTNREVQIESSDGGTRWVSVNATPLEDEGGDPERVLVTASDVTQLKEQARRLERQRDDLRQELDDVFERIDDAFFALDENLRFTHVNERAESLLDATAGELLGRRIWDEFEPGPLAEEAFEEALETRESISFEEYYEPLNTWFENHVYASDTGLSVYFRNVTERKARERELERYERILGTIDDGVYVVDGDGEFVLVNDAYADMLGYDHDELLGSHVSLVADEETIADARNLERELLTGFENRATATAELRTVDGDLVPVEATFSLLHTEDESYRVAVARDVTERQQFEETLKALHDSTRDLLGAESGTEVSEIVVAAAVDVLDLPGVAVYRRDDDVLSPDATSVDAGFMHVEVPDFPLDEGSITGSVFAGGDPRHYDDILDEPHVQVGPEDTEMRAGSFVPMGDHGILVAGSRDVGRFDHRTRQLVELLGANAEAAYDRVGREEELRRNRKRLTALNNLNAVVRDINEALVRQSTREEVEQVVCERLADSDSYEFAWYGEVDPDTQTVELGAEAGVEGYLDETTISVDPDDPEAMGPAGRAVRTQEMQVTRDALTDPDFEPWREQVDEYGFRSSAAIPVVHEDTLYGVLGVYAGRPGAFEDEERDVIGQLGDVVGHAIASIERKRALMSDEVIELEFRIRDTFEAEQLSETDGTISFDRSIPVGDGEFIVYGTATEDAVAALTELVDHNPNWESVEVVSEEFGTATFELHLSEPPLLSTAASNGGYVEAASITDGDYRVTLHFPPTVEIRDVVERVQGAYPSVEVVKRRQVSRTSESLQRLDEVLVEEMTDHQRTALEAAYFAGFFEWPRVRSGQEVADSLDVSDATFHQHLRLAENKLLGTLFEEPATSLR